MPGAYHSVACADSTIIVAEYHPPRLHVHRADTLQEVLTVDLTQHGVGAGDYVWAVAVSSTGRDRTPVWLRDKRRIFYHPIQMNTIRYLFSIL